jgi:hypothetical protein
VLDEIALQGSCLRPVSQVAASTRHTLVLVVHNSTTLRVLSPPGLQCCPDERDFHPSFIPGVKAVPQCCSVTLHHPRRAHDTGSSPSPSQFSHQFPIFARHLQFPPLPSRYLGTYLPTYRSKRSLRYAIIP